MSEEQQLQKTTGWASPFLEPAETIRSAAWGLRAARIPAGRGQRADDWTAAVGRLAACSLWRSSAGAAEPWCGEHPRNP